MSAVAGWDVIVVGAGPAGSATAALLAEGGARVLLVERAAFPRPKPCAEYLSPEAGRVLAVLGVFDDVARGAARLRGMRVVSPGGRVFEGHFRTIGAAAPYRPWGLAVPRARLDAILAQQAVRRGAELRERTTLEAYDATSSGVRAVLRSGASRETVRGAVLVGADGLRSRVARALGVARRRGPARLALVAHAREVREMTDVGEMHVVRGGYVGLADVGDGLTNVAAVVDRTGLPTGDSSTARLRQLLERVPAVQARLRTAQLAGPVLAAGPFGRYTIRATGAGVALVGDAADFFDPFTGEGICTALRGGALAAETAIAALDVPGPALAGRLAGYRRARRGAFAGKWAVERLIGYGMLAPPVFDRAVERLERRGWAHTLIGVTGDFVPARAVLNPRFLTGMLW